MPALRLIVVVFCIFIDVLSLIVSAVDPYPSCPGANPSQPCSASSVSALEKMLPRKYLLHDVNPGEGFNLRRDVYMRVARLVAALNADSQNEKWTLVLPPWGPLYHWHSKDIGSQSKIRWEEFFDINSLAGYVPVMEFEDYIHSVGRLIDKVFFLQHYPSTFTSSTWVEKYEESPCLEETGYYEESDGEFSGWFWGYYDVTSKEVACLYVQGSGSTLKPLLQEHSNYTAIMLDRAEVILHDNFGDPVYWEIRRSMRFSKRLRDVADKFRRDILNSDEERDGTVLEEDWKVVANRTKHALGGPYLAVHLRRQDYVRSRPKDVPDLKWAAEQIQLLLEKQGLKKVFVATDAGDEEFQALKTYLPEAVRFEPSKELRKELKDGGLAIVDQWIAAHASSVFEGCVQRQTEGVLTIFSSAASQNGYVHSLGISCKAAPLPVLAWMAKGPNTNCKAQMKKLASRRPESLPSVKAVTTVKASHDPDKLTVTESKDPVSTTFVGGSWTPVSRLPHPCFEGWKSEAESSKVM
ncbi:O-fucosyltransferase 2 isoform X1 [Dermacentor variabilis]|uniref:O-fucosyltransferase 2 isoform X1 n=2 Tax=Dermacentor variabilis TaxID=34621 RepID=UPI003F5B5FC2